MSGLEPLYGLYCRLGEVFLAQRQWDKAAACYREAIARQPAYVPAYTNLGVALQYQGQHQAALAIYQKALALDPDQARLYNNLGRSHLTLDQIDAAIAAYEQAIQLQPDYGLAYQNLGRLWQQQGQHQRAIAYFQTALRLQHQRQPLYSECGLSWLALGEPERAIVYFRAAVQPQWAFIAAYCRIYGQAIDAESAESADSADSLTLARAAGIRFLQALMRPGAVAVPHLAAAYRHWGDLLVQYGGRSQQRQAEQLYLQSARVQPQDRQVYVQLQHCLQEQGRTTAAVFVGSFAAQWKGNDGSQEGGLSEGEHLQLSLQSPGNTQIQKECAGLNCSTCLQAIEQTYGMQWVEPGIGGFAESHQASLTNSPLEPLFLGKPPYVYKNVYKKDSVADVGEGVSLPVLQSRGGDRHLDVLTLVQGRCWATPHESVWKICNAIAIFDQAGNQIVSRSRAYPGQLPNCLQEEGHLEVEQKRVERSPVTSLTGRIATVSGLSGHIYFHWMVDILPRLDLLRQSGFELNSLDGIIVNGRQQAFQKETLHLFGVPEDRVIESDRHPHIQAEELVVPAFAGSLGWVTPWTLQVLRDRILPVVPPATVEASYPKAIYISRADAQYRRVLNEAVVEEQLAALGVVSVTLTGRSVVEQAALFAHAKVIIAPHGSSLTNLVFCRPGTQVVEITSPHYRRPYFWEISRLLGLCHWVVCAEVLHCTPVRQVMSPNPLTEDLWVSESLLQSLKRILTSATDSAASVPALSSDSPCRVQSLPMLPYLKAAIAACEDAFRTQQEVLEKSRILGNVLQAQGLFDEAMHWHTLAVHPEPDLAEVHSSFGRLYTSQAEWDAAIAAYQAALDHRSDYADAHWGLAEVYARLNEVEAEVTHRQRAIALDESWSTAESQFLLGNGYLAQGQLSEAIACYQTAIAQRPRFLEAHYNLGTARSQNQQYEQAIAAYEAALTLNPDHAPSYHGLGHCFDALKETDRAIECYQRAIDLKPEFSTYHQLGNVLKQQQRWAEAAAAFQSAIALNPDFPWAHYQLGLMYLRLGKPEAAIAPLQAAIQRKPSVASFHYLLGNAFARLEQMDAAIAAYRQVVGIDAHGEVDLCSLGQQLRQQGYGDAAVVCYRQAIELNPKDPMPYVRLQYIPIQKRQLRELIRFYQQIQASGQDCHPLIWTNLGDALTQDQQIEEAIAAYRRGCYERVTSTNPMLAQREWRSQKEQAPNFIIIGATKCGTTSLHEYLKRHPKIFLPQRKELNFFIDRSFQHGKAWYLSHFPAITDEPGYYTGEASPNYFDSVGAEQRIAEMFPAMKLIVLLRNPVDRALSAYHHRAKDGAETRPLREAIAAEIEELSALTEDELIQRSCGYQSTIFGGLYVYKLKRWLKVFPREQLLILKSENFFKNTEEQMQQVYDFLGIPGTRASQYGKHNAGTYTVENDEVRQTLNDFFRPHNQHLEDYLGIESGWET
jgi:tetratricopeptide (TPR) repeat protein/capsular polysaccharide biosynthesis protein